MKTIFRLLALLILAPAALAQSVVPIAGYGAVVAPGGVTPRIQLQLLDPSGIPRAGMPVSFDSQCTYRRRGESGAYACVTALPGEPLEVVSDSQGRVSTPLYQADATSGRAWIQATAFIDGRPVLLPLYWQVGGSTADPAPLQFIAGNGQVVQVGQAAQPLVARVADDFGSPVPGAVMVFQLECAAGAPCLLPPAGPAMPVSDSNGLVNSGVRVANTISGAYSLSLAFAGSDRPGLSFAITNVAPARGVTSRTVTGSEAHLRIVDAPATCSITRMQPLDRSLAPRPPTMLAVPEGPIEVTISNCPAGSKLALSLQHPGGFPEGARVWTVFPTWQPVASTNFIEGFWEFSLTDGAAGDLDALANGTVTFVIAVGFGDPAAPNYQDLWWAGYEENGWGMSIVQHRDVLFAVIFAYDSAGQPTWYVMSGGTWNAARETYTGAIYSPRGRPLNEHVAANLVLGAPVGTLALSFTDVMNVRASIAFGTNNLNPTIKFLERQLFGPRDARPVGRMDDMWWAGVQRNGWGLAIHQQYASLFSVLFTYGTDGKPVWYPMPSGTWTANNVWEGHVYKPSGPIWPAPYDPALFVINPVGSFKLDFANGAATFDFIAEGRSSRFPIMRMGF